MQRRSDLRKADVLEFYENNASAVARAIGITPQAVQQWPEYVPWAAAYALERATGGKLKATATA